MKLTNLFVSLSILLLATPVSGQTQIKGEWCVSMSTAYSQGTNTLGDVVYSSMPYFQEEEYEIVIDKQDNNSPYGTPFYGHVDVGAGEITYFSGVLDGQAISMTHWDSVTRGILVMDKNKAVQINFINNAFDADWRRGKTSVGVAIKGTCQ